MGYAITARYAGPTNYRGSRVIATGPALTHDGPPVRATVSWDYGAGNPSSGAYDGRYDGWGDRDANYRRAADAVVAKLRAAGWSVSLAPDDRGALLPDDRTTVYVLRYGVGDDRDRSSLATGDDWLAARLANGDVPMAR